MQQRFQRAIAGGLGIGLVAVVAYGVSLDPTFEPVQQPSAGGRLARVPPKLISEAMNVPASKALKRAGCSVAGVLTRERLASLLQGIEVPPDMTGGVFCGVRSGIDVPRCGALARTLLETVVGPAE